MAAERVSEPLIKQGLVHVVKYLSTAVTLVSLIQFQQFYAFLKADNSNYMFLLGPYMYMLVVFRPCYHNSAHLSGYIKVNLFFAHCCDEH